MTQATVHGYMRRSLRWYTGSGTTSDRTWQQSWAVLGEGRNLGVELRAVLYGRLRE